MSFGKNYGQLLLAIWVIAMGALSLGVHFPFASTIVGVLGVAAGVLMLMGK